MGVEVRPKPVKVFVVTKTITFTGGAGAGAVGTVLLASVTGRVKIDLVIFCSSSLVSGGGGSLTTGTADNPFMVAGPDLASGIIEGLAYTANGGLSALTDGVVSRSLALLLQDDDLIFTVTDAPITAGQIEVEVIYTPILGGGSVN